MEDLLEPQQQQAAAAPAESLVSPRIWNSQPTKKGGGGRARKSKKAKEEGEQAGASSCSPTCSNASSSSSPPSGSFLPSISSPRPAAVQQSALGGDARMVQLPSEADIMRDFRAATDSEREAKRRIARLKRDLQRAKVRQADAEAQQRRQEEVRAFRAKLSEARGTNLAAAHADVDLANEEEVVALSELFNASLLYGAERGTSGEAAVRLTWYECFKAVDTNHSGLISFDEFKEACRKLRVCNISTDQVSDTQLVALWKALDLNGNGTISAGEWGHFMKRGAPAAAESARQRLFQLRLAHQRKLRAEADARSGRDLAAQLANVTPATEAELGEYATKFQAALRKMTGPQEVGNVWFKLFRAVDLNDSGLIDFHEFLVVARELLRLVETDVSDEQLRQLWKGLDADRSGKIDAGEFGRFMRRGEPPPSTPPRERMLANKRAELLAKAKDELQGRRHIKGAEELDAAPPADAEELTALATLFNEQLSKLYPDKEPSDVWYHCLKADCDGQIFFEDLEHMLRRNSLRHGLDLSIAQLSEPRLQSLWRALDDKGKGHLDVGTFIRFMRFGGGAAGVAAAQDVEGGTTPRPTGTAAIGATTTLRKQRLARDQQRVRDAKSSSVTARTAYRLLEATQEKEAQATRAMEEAQRLEEELRALGSGSS